MGSNSGWEQSYVEQGDQSAGPTLFLIVEDQSQDPVYINVDVESSRVEMILECLESSSWPVLLPREAA
jgi:hypothetical protein